MTRSKLLLAAALALSATPVAAQYMTHYLTAQWLDNGNRFCRYSNGTVLNVGFSICPYSIRG